MSDEKIRRFWLVMLIFSSLFTMANSWLLKRCDPHLNRLPETMQYSVLGFQVFIAVLFLWSIYHCAYRKPGTKWLLFCVVVTGISIVSNGVLYFTGQLTYALAHIPYYSLFLWLSQVQGVLWLILCWKLRKLNQKLRTL